MRTQNSYNFNLSMLCTIFLLSTPFKFFLDYIFNIKYSLITIFEMLSVVIFCITNTCLSKNKNYKLILYTTSYFLLLLIYEYYVILINNPENYKDILSSSYAFIKIILIYLVCIASLVIKANDKQCFNSVKILTLLMIYTTVYSILEFPYFNITNIFTSYGGNITSNNHLGFFRTNGGLGGDAISYSLYITIMSAIFLSCPSQIKSVNYARWLLVTISLYLCFSRSAFLSVSILIISWMLTYKRRLSHILFAPLLIIILFVGFCTDLPKEFYYLYIKMIGNSDFSRLNGWINALDFRSLEQFLFGISVGGNTGLFFDGRQKLVGDGYLVAVFADFGLIGLLIFSTLFVFTLTRILKRNSFGIGIFIVIILNLSINSAFEKTVVLMLFLVMLVIYKQTSKSCNSPTII